MPIYLPKLIGHRGVKDLAPENTLYSIERAYKLNLSWIEIDVKISKDNIPFLLHDDDFFRTTLLKGNPIHYKYEDISKLDAGSWFNEIYKNLYPPTLEEVLMYCYKKNIGVNIELKPNSGFELENANAIAKLIKNFKYQPKYFFSSFDWFSIIKIKELLPESYVGILVDKINSDKEIISILKKCKKNNFFSCGFNKKIITKDIVNYCKDLGIIITIYSSKNIKKKDALKLWDIGVDSIFIDNPLEYKDFLK